MKKGQVAYEYVIIVGVLLVVLIPIFFYIVNESSQQIRLSQAEDAVFSLANAADEVYALSPGTKKFVWVSIPSNAGTAVNDSEITISVRVSGQPSDITALTKANIAGTIPSEKGTYKIPVEHLDSGIVQIGSGNDTTPPEITWTDPSGQTCNLVTIRVNTDEPTLCNLDTEDKSYEEMGIEMDGNYLGHYYGVEPLTDGSYILYARCIDSFDNVMTESATIEFSIDNELCGDPEVSEEDPPIVNLIAPADGFSSNTSRNSFYYNVTDESWISVCNLIVDESIISSMNGVPVDVQNEIIGDLGSGNHSWMVSCTDAYGNTGNSSIWNIEIDAVLDLDSPVVILTAPADGTIRDFNLIKFFYNVTDATSDINSCTLEIEGILDLGGVSSQEVTDHSVEEGEETLSLSLNKGNYTWNVSCIDTSYLLNEGFSETRFLRVNSTTEESFITSCAGQCGFEGYGNGICENNVAKCSTFCPDCYSPEGDQFCIGGPESDTCCCVP